MPVTGTAGLEWTPTSDTLAFAKYSRGYKTGGFNATDMAPLPRTGEETVDSYELGWKQDVSELEPDRQHVRVLLRLPRRAGSDHG